MNTLVAGEDETSVRDRPQLEELVPMHPWRTAVFEASQPHAKTAERDLRLEAGAVRLETAPVAARREAFEGYP